MKLKRLPGAMLFALFLIAATSLEGLACGYQQPIAAPGITCAAC